MSANVPKRATRRDPAGSQVTPRDLLALRFIAEAQPVTTGQVRRLLDLSEDMAHRRLAVLRDHGLVRVHVPAQHAPNRYTLAPAALPVLARLTGSEDAWVPRGIDRIDLAHHAATVDVYVALRAATTRSRRVRLSRWVFEREIRKAAGASPGVLVPDAVASFEIEGRAVAVAFEVDLCTENPSFVAAKPYGQLRAAGTPMLGTTDWSVACVIAGPERRLHRLALAVAEAGAPDGLWHFALLDHLDSRSVLTPTWLTVVVDRAANAVSLASSSPFEGVGTARRNSSDGRTATATASAADRSQLQRRALSPEDAR